MTASVLPPLAGRERPSIRPARREDRAACVALWQALQAEQAAMDPDHRLAPDAATRWRADFDAWVRSRVDAVLVAERGGALVGLITAHPHRPPPLYADRLLVWMDDLYVAPGARGLGVGSALLDAAEAFARSLGAEGVEAGIRTANAPMRALWERRGGRETAVMGAKTLG